MADRYWVGGTGNWNDTANWSSSSGGPGGASVPTTGDNALFDQASTYTVSMNVNISVNNLIISAGTVTVSWGFVTITISGSYDCIAGTVHVGNSNSITYTATTTGNTIRNTNAAQLFFSGTGSWTLQSNLNGTSNGVVRISSGTLNCNGFNIVLSGTLSKVQAFGGTINFGSGSHTLQAGIVDGGSATLNFDSSTCTCVSFDLGSNTVNAGTSTLVINSAGTLAANGKTLYNVNFNLAGGAITGATTFNNLTITENTATPSRIALTISANQTVNGSFTANSAGITKRTLIKSNTAGTARTITAATVSISNCDFRDITGAGAGSWTGTSIGDMKGNSGITFDAAKTVYWNLAGAQNWTATGWSATSGGSPAAANFPLPQDTAVFNNAGSVTGTITVNGFTIGTIDMSARTNAMTLSSGTAAEVLGNWITGSGVTFAGTAGITFTGRTSQTITSAGKTITFPITVASSAGTVSLVDALNSSSSLALTLGTFNASNQTVTVASASITGTTTRTLTMGSGVWTLSGTGTVWNAATTTGLTFNKDTADIVLSNTTTTARTFAGGGLLYNNLTIGGSTGTSTLTFSGSNTFNEINSTKTVAHTITLTSGTTTTITTWSVAGTAGNIVSLRSSTAGSRATLAKAGGGTVTVQYFDIKDNQASPISTWFAENSINSGNNLNWTFAEPSSYQFFMFF